MANLQLSSWQRARVDLLRASIQGILEEPLVEVALSTMNKGVITIQVRDGEAVEVSPQSDLRRGKELEK